jgi:acetyltransferase-like isoleucine patch superfamily enzyme
MKKLIKLIFNFLTAIYNYIILKINRVSVGKGFTCRGFLYVSNRGHIQIGDNVTINSGSRYSPIGGQTQTRIIVYHGARLCIEKNVGISNTTIVSQSEINIGADTLIGGSCNILDTNFHSLDPKIRGTESDVGKTRPIYIGRNVFIGAHSIILKGVSIVDYSIIGAGSIIRQKDNRKSQC